MTDTRTQRFAPSPRQIEALQRADPARPLVLFYQYSHARPQAADEDPAGTALDRLAPRHRGRLIWSAREEQVLVGPVAAFQHHAQYRFDRGSDVVAFVQSGEHAQALRGLASVQVAVIHAQPRAVALLSGVLARVLPFVPFDNATDPSEEPGVGTSGVMPTAAAIAALKNHPDQNDTVVMVNWLKYRERANYATPAGTAAAPASGRAAYHRYGKVALVTTHSIGAKLLFAGRYRQILIGNDGDPGEKLWDEFVLMQYPGRASFAYMTSLKRYRKALHHREAGLTERGQGLAVTRPRPGFEWRR